MSDFIESVDHMIGSHFSLEARWELEKLFRQEPGNWFQAERILYQLILTSIAHARNQVERRRTGTMTFEEAMAKARTENTMVTRPAWNIFRAIRLHYVYIDDEWDGELFDYRLDNCDGSGSGSGSPYKPTDEDRAATDWMLYQRPADNWIELEFSRLPEL